MSEKEINPIGSIYVEFEKILNNLTIKYSFKAEEYETLESRQLADGYLDAISQKDTFYTYIDYTEEELIEAGMTNVKVIREIIDDNNTELVPTRFRDKLLELRRQRVIDTFDEKNDYYRMLNGYPSVNDKDYLYITENIGTEYGIDYHIPIHKIQDAYNTKENPTGGDYLISLIEGSGYIDKLISEHPDKEYLKYIGSGRISIQTARNAKNFQVIKLKPGKIKYSIYDKFLQLYEECRIYFMSTIYIPSFRNFIEFYDNFIAMCIFLMTIHQIVMRQIGDSVDRNYFDLRGVKSLYQAYNVPYNLNIDEDTQNGLLQNLNLMIQNKATNKVIYDIANLLGFTNIDIYNYLLVKKRKFDLYGAPVVAYKEEFNPQTGTVETVPDYEQMYEVYFQKEDLDTVDFADTLTDDSKKVSYKTITEADPLWWEDRDVYNRVWDTEYNYVETKYLGFGLSYRLSEMMFENVILLKMLLQNKNKLGDIVMSIPKILENTDVPLFDVIVLMISLMTAKHNLGGEIISIPTQVAAVVDYMRNVEEEDKLVDTLSFNFNFFDPNNEEARLQLEKFRKLMGENEYEKFMSWTSAFNVTAATTKEEKIAILNKMYSDIKSIYRYLRFMMTSTSDKDQYVVLRRMYDTLFYSREIRDVFTITGEYTGTKRTAWTYFEFLYHTNPKLYNAIFTFSSSEQYNKYLVDHELTEDELPYVEFMSMVELGEIKLKYDTLKDLSDGATKDEIIYFYVDHIISRLDGIIDNLNFMHLLNEMNTALEDLLRKLVRFFKSFTIDMVSFDVMLLFDMKPANTIKVVDKLHHMTKLILIKGYHDLRLSYSDAINKLISEMDVKDKYILFDKVFYYSELLLDKKMDNIIQLYDSSDITRKDLFVIEDSKVGAYDAMHCMTTTETVKDGLKFNDKVSLYWTE